MQARGNLALRVLEPATTLPMGYQAPKHFGVNLILKRRWCSFEQLYSQIYFFESNSLLPLLITKLFTSSGKPNDYELGRRALASWLPVHDEEFEPLQPE